MIKGKIFVVRLFIFFVACGFQAYAQPASTTDALRDAALRKQRLATPRSTVENFLEWQNPPAIDYTIAAEAFTVNPALSSEERATLARQLKRVLDSRGLFVRLESIPDSANHRNPETELAEYTLFPKDLPAVYLVKSGDEWLFSSTTVNQIPQIYAETFSAALDQVVDRLPAVLRDQFLGVALWQYAGLALLLALGFFIRKLFAFTLNIVGKRVFSRLSWEWDKDQIHSLVRPVTFLLMVGFLLFFYPMLQLPVRFSFFVRIVLQLLAAASVIWLLFQIIDAFSRYLSRITAKTDSKLDDQLIPMLSKSLKAVVLLLGVLTVMQSYGYSVGSIIAGLGIGGLALALAAQNTLANFFGSVMIFLDKPFQVGDFIKVGDTMGSVQEVGFRSTRLRTPDDSVITVPNSQLADSRIDNLGLRNYRRIFMNLGLTYSTTPTQMQAFVEGVRAIIAANPHMRRDFYEVNFNAFGDYSLNVLVVCFLKVATINEEWRERHNFLMEILRLAERIGVEFAFPTQTLHIDSFFGRQPRQTGRQIPETELAEIVEDFGPEGKLAQPTAPRLHRNGKVVDFTMEAMQEAETKLRS